MAEPRGFARMTLERRQQLGSQGGTAAVGRHRWTKADARIAGRAGGLARAARAAQARLEAAGKGTGAPGEAIVALRGAGTVELEQKTED